MYGLNRERPFPRVVTPTVFTETWAPCCPLVAVSRPHEAGHRRGRGSAVAVIDFGRAAASIHTLVSLWTVDQVAQFLQMSASWVYREASARRLPCKRVGRSLRFREDEIRAWVDRGGDE